MKYNELLAPFEQFFDATQRVYVLYLATSLLLAVLVYWYDRRQRNSWSFGFEGALGHPPSSSPIKEIVPPAVYTHRSAVTDYLFFICNIILYAFILAPFQFFGAYFSASVFDLLASFFTPASFSGSFDIWGSVVVGVILALVADFGNFFSHLVAHRVRWLWEFHKVHHSAAVLTPITVYRMHPVDDVFTLIVGGALSGGVDAVLRFFLFPDTPPLILFGLNFVTFVFYLTGYHLRHSHIWLSYGPRVSKFLISPAQHQIHHSVARPHWNKNFGFIFAFWDWMFGTLYVPHTREEITFGIGGGEEREYSSVVKLYFLPFLKCGRILFGKKSK